jgi:hypothetical protein
LYLYHEKYLNVIFALKDIDKSGYLNNFEIINIGGEES